MRAAEFADDLGPQMQHRICNFPKRIDSSRGQGPCPGARTYCDEDVRLLFHLASGPPILYNM